MAYPEIKVIQSWLSDCYLLQNLNTQVKSLKASKVRLLNILKNPFAFIFILISNRLLKFNSVQWAKITKGKISFQRSFKNCPLSSLTKICTDIPLSLFENRCNYLWPDNLSNCLGCLAVENHSMKLEFFWYLWSRHIFSKNLFIIKEQNLSFSHHFTNLNLLIPTIQALKINIHKSSILSNHHSSYQWCSLELLRVGFTPCPEFFSLLS